MIRCVAIDDEPIALSIIEEYCKRFGDISLKTFSSPLEGMEFVTSSSPDILFLDIEMNACNGISLARKVPESTCIVFTTAFAQYAFDSFEVDAVDFLHKPIFYPRFERAMEKALRYIEGRRKMKLHAATLTLRAEYKNVMIDLDDILFIEAMDNYVKIFRKNKPTVLSQITMKEMESLLPCDRFARCHRSYIMRLDAIDRFSNTCVYLHDYGRPIPVGRKYKDSLRGRLRDSSEPGE